MRTKDVQPQVIIWVHLINILLKCKKPDIQKVHTTRVQEGVLSRPRLLQLHIPKKSFSSWLALGWLLGNKLWALEIFCLLRVFHESEEHRVSNSKCLNTLIRSLGNVYILVRVPLQTFSIIFQNKGVPAITVWVVLKF